VPRTSQLTVGYERQLGAAMAATVDYVHSWNQNQLMTYNLNPGTRVNTSRTGAITYTDLEGIAAQLGVSPFGNAVYERVNDGSSQFDGVNFSLEKRLSAGWAARVSYAIGHARGNAEANPDVRRELRGVQPREHGELRQPDGRHPLDGLPALDGASRRQRPAARGAVQRAHGILATAITEAQGDVIMSLLCLIHPRWTTTRNRSTVRLGFGPVLARGWRSCAN